MTALFNEFHLSYCMAWCHLSINTRCAESESCHADSHQLHRINRQESLHLKQNNVSSVIWYNRWAVVVTNRLNVCIHDTAGCPTGSPTGWMLVHTLQPVLQLQLSSRTNGWTTGWTTSCIHDTAGCPTGCPTHLTSGCNTGSTVVKSNPVAVSWTFGVYYGGVSISCHVYALVRKTTLFMATLRSRFGHYIYGRYFCLVVSFFLFLQGCPKLTKGSQPLVDRSSPYYGDMWRRYCCLTSFFRLSICALVAKI